MVVICCSRVQICGRTKFLKFHIPLYSIKTRSGWYCSSSANIFSGTRSSSFSIFTNTVFVFFRSLSL